MLTDLDITNCVATDSEDGGGGLHLLHMGTAEILLARLNFSCCNAFAYGGGLYALGTQFVARDLTFWGNQVPCLSRVVGGRGLARWPPSQKHLPACSGGVRGEGHVRGIRRGTQPFVVFPTVRVPAGPDLRALISVSPMCACPSPLARAPRRTHIRPPLQALQHGGGAYILGGGTVWEGGSFTSNVADHGGRVGEGGGGSGMARDRWCGRPPCHSGCARYA